MKTCRCSRCGAPMEYGKRKCEYCGSFLCAEVLPVDDKCKSIMEKGLLSKKDMEEIRQRLKQGEGIRI